MKVNGTFKATTQLVVNSNPHVEWIVCNLRLIIQNQMIIGSVWKLLVAKLVNLAQLKKLETHHLVKPG